ncbi:hypothetical protein EDB81DRAFT_785294 [Dactylonectria macrodidyma]|uniref:Uncharacterized protein n=1 Tax=Dactylonectria macrodidyma TaxID=307937 RepID=A0A9P9FII2_9HYPO|nr:hypothetical protein EDB81DRAFT_785294 [Dactylonectria macrodidyma]
MLNAAIILNLRNVCNESRFTLPSFSLASSFVLRSIISCKASSVFKASFSSFWSIFLPTTCPALMTCSAIIAAILTGCPDWEAMVKTPPTATSAMPPTMARALTKPDPVFMPALAREAVTFVLLLTNSAAVLNSSIIFGSFTRKAFRRGPVTPLVFLTSVWMLSSTFSKPLWTASCMDSTFGSPRASPSLLT